MCAALKINVMNNNYHLKMSRRKIKHIKCVYTYSVYLLVLIRVCIALSRYLF